MNKKPSFKPKMPYARSKILTYTKEKGVRPPESTSVGMERVPVDAVAGRVRGRPPSILPQEAVDRMIRLAADYEPEFQIAMAKKNEVMV